MVAHSKFSNNSSEQMNVDRRRNGEGRGRTYRPEDILRQIDTRRPSLVARCNQELENHQRIIRNQQDRLNRGGSTSPENLEQGVMNRNMSHSMQSRQTISMMSQTHQVIVTHTHTRDMGYFSVGSTSPEGSRPGSGGSSSSGNQSTSVHSHRSASPWQYSDNSQPSTSSGHGQGTSRSHTPENRWEEYGQVYDQSQQMMRHNMSHDSNSWADGSLPMVHPSVSAQIDARDQSFGSIRTPTPTNSWSFVRQEYSFITTPILPGNAIVGWTPNNQAVFATVPQFNGIQQVTTTPLGSIPPVPYFNPGQWSGELQRAQTRRDWRNDSSSSRPDRHVPSTSSNRYNPADRQRSRLYTPNHDSRSDTRRDFYQRRSRQRRNSEEVPTSRSLGDNAGTPNNGVVAKVEEVETPKPLGDHNQSLENVVPKTEPIEEKAIKTEISEEEGSSSSAHQHPIIPKSEPLE